MTLLKSKYWRGKMLNTILFVISIFISLLFGIPLIIRIIRGQAIPGIGIIIFSLAITSVITHLIGIW